MFPSQSKSADYNVHTASVREPSAAMLGPAQLDQTRAVWPFGGYVENPVNVGMGKRREAPVSTPLLRVERLFGAHPRTVTNFTDLAFTSSGQNRP
jgi:hypothetical protein